MSEKKTLQELLSDLPFSFQKEYICKCNCCDTIITETITYELQLKLIRLFDKKNEEIRNYLLFYQPRFYSNFESNPSVIGCGIGQGKSDLEELKNELKKLIN